MQAGPSQAAQSSIASAQAKLQEVAAMMFSNVDDLPAVAAALAAASALEAAQTAVAFEALAAVACLRLAEVGFECCPA